MDIWVCVKQVLDWNRSAKDFAVDPQTLEAAVSFARYQLDQFDEIAIEVALKCRAGGDSRVRAVSVGPESAEDMLKHAFSMKVDAATLIVREEGVDTAGLLAALIRREAPRSVVLCGRTSSDMGTGATGPRLAEMLGMPFIANVIEIAAEGDQWTVRRETAGGFERLRVSGPFVATVTNAKSNIPRAPSMKDKMWAFRQKVDIVPAAALESEKRPSVRLRLLRRELAANLRNCRMVEGAPAEQARALAQYIRGSM